MIHSNLDFERKKKRARKSGGRNIFLTMWSEQFSSFEGSQAVPIHPSGGGTFHRT
jgi:hypothetical protein